MSSISRLTAAATSGTLEIAPALANFNFDFSLYKVEAPKEFQGVGAALSTLRREEAEGGRPHATARKLGALFERLLPSTPELIKAYGRRASEISQSSSVNSQGLSSYGVFANRVGTDATSVWAAATSGQGAIAVHLLACMLARIWDGPEATSIWVEIVQKRKQEILTDLEQSDIVDLATIAAARQELTRTQIAEWDASARAWLRAADGVKTRQLTQLRLIIDNVQVPVNGKTDTYASVINAWTSPLTQMEGLITGISQKAQSGDILLSISSWHLFPDMMVVVPCTTHVRQHDSIFAAGGVLTIGLEKQDLQNSGVSWSLPLAHLRYYGAPVVSVGTIESTERSRISLNELLQATLGCFLQGLGEAGSNTLRTIGWLSHLSDLLTAAASNGSVEADLLINGDASASWLNLLLGTAKRYLTSTGDERLPKVPLFGLLRRGAFVSLIQMEEDRIQYLRRVAVEIAERLQLGSNQIFIRYKHHYPDWSKSVYEYATALPWPSGTKRKFDHSIQESKGHRRWLYAGGDLHRRVSDTRYHQRLDIHFDSINLLRHRDSFIPTDFVQWHKMRGHDNQSFRSDRDLFTSEECHLIREKHETRKSFYSSRGEDVFQREDELVEDFATAIMGAFWDHMGHPDLNPHQTPWYKFLCGGVDSAALFVLEGEENLIDLVWTAGPESQEFYSLFESGEIDPRAVVHNLTRAFQTADAEVDPHLKSLKAISTAATVYKNLLNASVDIRVLQQHLYSAPWIKSCRELSSGIPFPSNRQTPQSLRPYLPDLPAAFACIAMFESGQYCPKPAELSNVMAMSSGDSIYVAAALLCDPSEEPYTGDIRRVVGNIGRPGIAFLVPPVDPLVKEVKIWEWPQIARRDFDGQFQNCFESTSLHLSFTSASSPINVRFSGAQDTEVYMLETLISVHDRGKWVADLDVLKALKSLKLRRYDPCNEVHYGANTLKSRITCIDGWPELLDAPEEHISLVRAHKNWQARLAAVALSIAMGYETLIFPEKVCWQCFEDMVGLFWKFNSVIAIA